MSEKRLRPSRRYRYTEYYRMRQKTLADGTVTEEAEYTGPLLLADHSLQEYRKVRLSALLISVFTLTAGLLLLAVMDFAVYKGGLYALIPASMALFPALYMLLGSLKLPGDDRMLQLDTHRFAHKRIKRASAGVIVLYSLTLVLTAVFLLSTGVSPQTPDLIYLFLTAGPLLLNGILLLYMKKLQYSLSEQ